MSKRKKLVLIGSLLSIGVSLYFVFQQAGTTYDLPALSNAKNRFSKRHISNYLKKDSFEWFLVTPDGVPLYVLEAGKGKTIVSLHGGFGMSHDYMRSFLSAYEKDYHMVYYDQRGSLRSSVPNNNLDKYITMDNMVNDLELLRRELKEEKLTIIAHSMGAVLVYEYMKRFPDKINDIIIISGFTPKFPSTNAGLYDIFTSQRERDSFANRNAVNEELLQLNKSLDTTSSEYVYLRWKIQSSALQIYDFTGWRNTQGGIGYFNQKINKIIGPESNIPLWYGIRYYLKERQFKKGTLDVNNTNEFSSPINYLPEIHKHKGSITYILGRYEIGDWNLRLHNRYLKETKTLKMHIFEQSGHMIWLDETEKFHAVLGECLKRIAS